MTGKDLKLGREQKGWTQEEAASRLSVSQPYLSLMEKGARPVSKKLARKAASAFKLSATTLPVETSWETVQPKDANTLAMDFAALGYPGFEYLKSKRKKKNPGEVLLSALSAKRLESRVAEALPWLLLQYTDLDWIHSSALPKQGISKIGSAWLHAWRVELRKNVERKIRSNFFVSRSEFWNGPDYFWKIPCATTHLRKRKDVGLKQIDLMKLNTGGS
jgi:transcriptional regulator with XRE-family HTH domain